MRTVNSDGKNKDSVARIESTEVLFQMVLDQGHKSLTLNVRQKKKRKQSECWLTDKKQNVVYTDNWILRSLKQEVQQYSTTWINLGDMMLSEMRQSQKRQMQQDSTSLRYLK